ncbi:hypothetical protein RB195_006813 [Necator americanus]|uniref:Uncharacterized protein n=1 Tax=Necator americanus TaxID=51031 RepID=A0ABR1BXQ3_NECAM
MSVLGKTGSRVVMVDMVMELVTTTGCESWSPGVARDLIIANTQYQKRKSHLITCTTGGHEAQIDFWMLRRRNRRLLQNSKVITTDHVTAQHHLLVMDLKISRPRKRHPSTKHSASNCGI